MQRLLLVIILIRLSLPGESLATASCEDLFFKKQPIIAYSNQREADLIASELKRLASENTDIDIYIREQSLIEASQRFQALQNSRWRLLHHAVGTLRTLKNQNNKYGLEDGQFTFHPCSPAFHFIFLTFSL